MVIHDHEIGRLCFAPRIHDVTIRIIAAALPKTVVARRGHARPQRMCVVDTRHLSEIARARHSRPRLKFGEQRIGPRDALERALRHFALEAIHAEIIRSTLQECDFRRRADGARHQRNIFGEELILQRARARRDQHAQPREQGGYEIGEGFTRAGTRFDDQRLASGKALRDRRCHAQLRLAGPKTRQVAGEGPRDAQNVIDIQHAGGTLQRESPPVEH